MSIHESTFIVVFISYPVIEDRRFLPQSLSLWEASSLVARAAVGAAVEWVPDSFRGWER